MEVSLPAPAVDQLGNLADLRPSSAKADLSVLLTPTSDDKWLPAAPIESDKHLLATPTRSTPEGIPTPPTRLLSANAASSDARADALAIEAADPDPSESSSLRLGSTPFVPSNSHPPPTSPPAELRPAFRPGAAVKNMLDRMNFTGQIGLRPGISGHPAEPVFPRSILGVPTAGATK